MSSHLPWNVSIWLAKILALSMPGPLASIILIDYIITRCAFSLRGFSGLLPRPSLLVNRWVLDNTCSKRKNWNISNLNTHSLSADLNSNEFHVKMTKTYVRWKRKWFHFVNKWFLSTVFFVLKFEHEPFISPWKCCSWTETRAKPPVVFSYLDNFRYLRGMEPWRKINTLIICPERKVSSLVPRIGPFEWIKVWEKQHFISKQIYLSPEMKTAEKLGKKRKN